MAETTVDKPVCTDCGTDIRAAALFCYHCGTAVAVIESQSKSKSTRKFSRKSRVKEDKRKAEIGPGLGDQIAAKDSVGDSIEERSATNGNAGMKLRSAASIRKNARRLEPKKIEIYWEEHENAPNKWFIGFSILLLLFTIVILLIAMYLK